MRKIRFISLAVIVIIMITAQSCKKGFLDGVNDNPNSPTEVTPRVLLPGVEGSLAYTQGGDIERFTGIMSQYITGAFRQFFGYNQYIFTEEDFNNLWYNMYAGTMENYKVIMDIDDANPGFYQIYGGIARIQMAYALALTTDMFGDVPFDEAFQGNLNLTPAYQSQQEIYDIIQGLLTTGIDELVNDPGTDLDVPGGNDFIYGGDVDAWIAFGHALKARYYLHLTKVDAGAAQKALDEIIAGGVITTAAYPFSTSGQSPWFQYIDQRDDITYAAEEPGATGNALSNTMQSRNDPRYGIYFDLNGDFGHWDVGYLGPYFQAEDASVFLMTTAEQYFIEAEARLRTDDQSGAQTALTAAIDASFTQFGLDPADSAQVAYSTTYGTLTGDFNTDLKTIITEKWIANFLHPESWTDWRRTGFPELTPNSGSAIPRRFIYPTNERLYNPNAINQNSDLFQPRLWWDAQ